MRFGLRLDALAFKVGKSHKKLVHRSVVDSLIVLRRSLMFQGC